MECIGSGNIYIRIYKEGCTINRSINTKDGEPGCAGGLSKHNYTLPHIVNK